MGLYVRLLALETHGLLSATYINHFWFDRSQRRFHHNKELTLGQGNDDVNIWRVAGPHEADHTLYVIFGKRETSHRQTYFSARTVHGMANNHTFGPEQKLNMHAKRSERQLTLKRL